MKKSEKNILIACSCYYPDVKGGGEVSTKLLAEALKNEGYNVIIAAISDSEKIEYINEIKVYRVKFKNLYWTYNKNNVNILKKLVWHIVDSSNFSIAKRIVDIAKKENVSNLITSTIEDISSATWSLAKQENIKTYHILRSYSLLCVQANMFKNNINCSGQCASCSTMTYLKKFHSNNVDHVVGISNYILNTHMQSGYFKNSKSHVINNICTDKEIFDSDIKYLLEWVPKKTIKLGYIGSLLSIKGIEIFFEAISKTDNIDCYEIIIAGDGNPDYKQSLIQLSTKLKIKASFIGHVKQDYFFSLIDWLIVPSVWNEPFGRIVVEAFFYNIPVIGANKGGIAELITPHVGLLYDSKQDLTNELNNIARNKFSFDFSEKKKYFSRKISSEWDQLLENN